MKSILALTLVISLCGWHAAAQTRGRRSTPAVSRLPNPGSTPETTTIYLSGKVVVDDGTVLTDSASIQTVCGGQKRTETHTDSHGNFSFQFGGRYTASNAIGFDPDSSSTIARPGVPDRRSALDCQVQASLPGFSSSVVDLAGRFSASEGGDIGRIVLHRLNNVEGTTLSVTTAQAPSPARKAFEKGQQQQKSGKWDDAQKSLQKAVEIYPKFAVAWFELGLVQLQTGDASAARHSFQQSIASDASYVSPYLVLMRLAMHEQKWHELDEITDKLLLLNSVGFPEVWFANSLANYFLQDFAEAEKSARRGLQVDLARRVPKLEYVLGMVLLKKPDYSDALQHLKTFLSLVTEPAEVAEAQKQVDEAARLSSVASRESK